MLVHAIAYTFGIFLFCDLSNGLAKTDCSLASECTGIIEGSDCDLATNQCVCLDGKILSSDLTACLTLVTTYNGACTDSVQCSQGISRGALCLNGQCSCKDGYHHIKGVCYKDVPLGGQCSVDEDCYANYDFIGLKCNRESLQCECRDTYYSRAGGCRRKVDIGGSCVLDEDCDSNGGKCISAKCVRSCSSFDECGCDYGECVDESYCKCSQEPNLASFVDNLAVNQSKSVNNNECDPGYFICKNCGTNCVPELGTSCSADISQCKSTFISLSQCIDNEVCGCNGGNIIGSKTNQECIKLASTINSSCKENAACSIFSDNSICLNGTCQCKENYHFDANAKYCKKSVALGESCEDDGACFVPSGSFVECKEEICTCTSESHLSADEKDCRQNATHVNDPCIDNYDCNFSDEAIICNADGKCACAPNFFTNSEMGCSLAIGGTCIANDDCSHIQNSACLENQCACNDNYVTAANKGACLEESNYNQECAEIAQCTSALGELSVCQDNKCLCNETAHYILKKCFATKNLGEKCGARAECVPSDGDLEAYMCQNAICTCQYGYYQKNNICVKK